MNKIDFMYIYSYICNINQLKNRITMIIKNDKPHVFVEAEVYSLLRELKEIHNTFHFKMRDFLKSKNLLDEFYDYFQDGDELDKKYFDLIENNKHLLSNKK